MSDCERAEASERDGSGTEGAGGVTGGARGARLHPDRDVVSFYNNSYCNIYDPWHTFAYLNNFYSIYVPINTPIGSFIRYQIKVY